MSLTKYMQFYRDSGFFSGSIIRATVTDNSFFGADLTLSKNGKALQTKTIGSTGVVDFFTDESGILELGSDNGAAVLSGTVDVSAYATYNIALSTSASDTSRKIYSSGDVTIEGDATSGASKIAYTGDVSAISAFVSDTSLVTASVDGNIVTVADAGNNKSGKCTVTATVAATDRYDASSISFNVNKLTGQYGTWQDAPDEGIASMVAKADAGEIDLADYWNIGDTRRVRLGAIEAGTEVTAQPEQEIELVILHNPKNSAYYRLTAPTSGLRYQPNFIIGTKDCLANTSAMGYFSKTIEATYSASGKTYVYSNESYMPVDANNTAELLTMLNEQFISALPSYLQNALKSVNRRYVCSDVSNSRQSSIKDIYSYTALGTKSHKVSLANIIEVGFSSAFSSVPNRLAMPEGVGIYDRNGQTYKLDQAITGQLGNNAINTCGEKLRYFADGGSTVKSKGIDGREVDYLLVDAFMFVSREYAAASTCNARYSAAFYINSNGELSTNTLTAENERVAQRGIAPIMFI